MNEKESNSVLEWSDTTKKVLLPLFAKMDSQGNEEEKEGYDKEEIISGQRILMFSYAALSFSGDRNKKLRLAIMSDLMGKSAKVKESGFYSVTDKIWDYFENKRKVEKRPPNTNRELALKIAIAKAKIKIALL